ncbi:MAG TPA: gamma carbonic anhydrase family protein [Phycisphaerae bacterium]|nr:gamma carbonic anhydrase family protein [Phycisphaerae bacterium]HRR87468.1 gamma carbonic anhydrase family protein [Phycisphaerae bacterium]
MSLHEIERIGEVYVARSAIIVGDVTLGEGCNIWHHVVLRGDVAPIRLGKRVNVQDGSVLHCNHDIPLEIADDVAIGHLACVHCKRVGPNTLIATRATVLDNCEIGQDCMIGAGAVVPPGTVIPDGSVALGMPAKVIRPIKDRDREYIRRVLTYYQDLARRHAEGEFKSFTSEETGKTASEAGPGRRESRRTFHSRESPGA